MHTESKPIPSFDLQTGRVQEDNIYKTLPQKNIITNMSHVPNYFSDSNRKDTCCNISQSQPSQANPIPTLHPPRPSTTRTLSAEALAAFSALEVTRPDVLRATPAYRALEHFGLALRSLATGRTGGGGSFGRFMVFWVFATDRSSSS